MVQQKINSPVCVFDAGIGSYDIARKIAKAYPLQDIIYFGDRASFPYGMKTRDQLLRSIRNAISFLSRFDPSVIVLASNAPSIMVLDEIRQDCNVPIIGVAPPVEQALSLSVSGEIGILGVNSLIESKEMRTFADRFKNLDGSIHLLPASDLVGLVESGQFLNDREYVEACVLKKLSSFSRNIDVFTLSSTHLPWLRGYFEGCAPHYSFLDPADTIIASLSPYCSTGNGDLHIVATECEDYSISGFRSILAKLGVSTDVVAKSEFLRRHLSSPPHGETRV